MSLELTTVLYSLKEQNKIVAENSLKMLNRRYKLPEINELIKNFQNKIEANENIFDVKINEEIFSLIVVNSKITNISQLEDFLVKDTQKNKILFVQSLTKKIYKQAMGYKNVEVFMINEFLEDIPSKYFIPKHQLLNLEEKEELLKIYKFKEFANIISTDMMCRYFNGKIDDIFRIERYNMNSGKSVFYRKVIEGTLDPIFF